MFQRTQLVLLAGCLVSCGPVAMLLGSPLPRDPNNLYGQFDNGLKYIVRKHDLPAERVAMYLHIKTGALNESDTQNGLAHFLEHMGFNGSTHFAPGELIPHMSKMGMTFGAHSNAHTTYHETVYKLFMPDNTEESVNTAMTVLGDFANGLLLLEAEINNERGVVLEESRSRKSAQERIRKELLKNVLAGSRIASHDVIGIEAQIAAFPKAEFDDYWNTWYRPDNMTLIVVGDIDPQAILAKATPVFGTWKARAAARDPLGAQLTPMNEARAFVISDPEMPACQVQILAVKPGRPPMSSFAEFRFNEVENIGPWIVSRRLDEMVKKGEANFFGGGCAVQPLFNEAILPLIATAGMPEKWNGMLEQAIIELNRAIEHGFTEQELQLAKEATISDAERAVEREATLDARAFVNMISGAVGLDYPILSAAQNLELTKQALADVTLSEVQQVFVDNFKTANMTYVITAPQREGVALPTSQDVLAAAAEAWARKTEVLQQAERITALLEQLPQPGQVVSRQTDPDLQITTATFSNGAVVHHRFMDYKKDEATITITFSGGIIEETAANRGVSSVASLINATSKLTSTQIRDYMTGKKVNVGGGVGLDASTLRISGSPQHLETGMQLAHLYITDGKIEPSALDVWKEATLQEIDRRKNDARAQASMAMDRVFYGGDVRFMELTAEQVGRLTTAMGEQWARRISGNGAIEVAVVGDIQLEPALELVSRYVGSLPPRSMGAAEALNPLRKLSRGPGPYTDLVRFETITDKAFVRAGFVGTDERNVQDRRLLNMVGRIISERMIKRIREAEQLVYSIRCSSQAASAVPGTGIIGSSSFTKPENAERLADTIVEMMREFAANGPTAEELATAKKQVATDLEQTMKEPGFWLGQLQEFKYRDRTLAELKDLPDAYQAFTAEQLQAGAAKYLTPENVIRFLAVPQTAAAATPAG